MRETDLYPAVKAFLERQGYAVKGEVQGCDVVARRGAEAPVIVELKTRFSLPLVLQGVRRQSLSDAVYLAFPAKGAGEAWKSARRDVLALCRRLGLGLLVVTLEPEPFVEAALDPGPYQPRKSKRRLGLLLREFERRRGDPTPGGGSKAPIMTAYRQDALRLARTLDIGGPASPRALRTATGVDRAPAILQRDVYGWFQRVERGVYALSDAGRAAIARYEDPDGPKRAQTRDAQTTDAQTLRR